MANPDIHNLQFKSVAYAGLAPGPRLIVTGAVHGNETCGTSAITRIMAEIDAGSLAIAKGSVTFVPVTNPLAYAKGERAGDRNLNRNLGPIAQPKDFEDHVANWLCPLLARHEVLLDLHSTRAATEPFAMLGPKDNDGPIEPFRHFAAERALARRLGVKRFVEGWLGTYARGVERRVKEGLGSALNTDARYGIGTTEYMRSQGGYAITLECGQHQDVTSPEVAYRAIRNTLAFLGLTKEAAPEPVAKYDLIATRADGTKLTAPNRGRILFPDAGAQPGHEWFYLAESIPEI
jgi:predicted deacylase